MQDVSAMRDASGDRTVRAVREGTPVSTNIVDLTDEAFDREIRRDGPILVDFWAPWCSTCRAIAPMLDQVAGEEAGRLRVAKLDVDANPASADRFGVAGLPTLILFKDGRPVERLVGFRTKGALLDAIRPHLGPRSPISIQDPAGGRSP
jgi:thioredoxin 1